MTTVTGGGTGNEMAWNVLSGVFTIVAYSDTGFTLRNMSGDITAVGSGLAFTVTESAPGVPVISVTAGVITSVTIGVNAGQNTWTGFGSIWAVTAFNRISNNDKAGFFSLFFGGNDTFNISNAAANPGMYGFAGDDTFNVVSQGTGLIDGGSGNDTLNISGGVPPLSFFNSYFNVTNVETINLAPGFDYTLGLMAGLVYSGHTTIIDGHLLGSGNKLILDNSSDQILYSYNGSTFTGNLIVLGGAGDDIFQGGSGSNIFNGGGGNDTVSFHIGTPVGYVFSGTVGVTANLSNPASQSLGGFRGGSATFISIENLIGTKLNDTLTGNAGVNRLDGDDGGNDVFNGMGGDDTIIGGLGDDTAIFSGMASAYTITHTSGTTTTTVSGPDGTDTLNGIDFAQFSDQTVKLSGMTLTSSNVSAAHAQTLFLSSLVSTTNIEGLPVQKYQLWDGDMDPASGHWVVNNIAQAARTVITVASYDSVYFAAGYTDDHLQIRASDGRHWSAADNAAWSPFTVSVPLNHAPQVTTTNATQSHNQAVALSTMVSVTDADADSMVSYQLFDGTTDPNSGHFELYGTVFAARTVVTVSGNSLSDVKYVSGTVGDTLQVRAFDGGLWSAPNNAPWAPFTVTVPANHAPVVSTSDVAATNHGQVIYLTTMFGATDPDGDTITSYQVFDGNPDPDSGHLAYGGFILNKRQVYTFGQNAIGNITYTTGGVADTLQIRVSDGGAWSAADNAPWAPFTITVPVNHAPVVTTAPLVVSHNQILSSSSLATITDVDGDSIVEYQVFDGTVDPASGHFVIGGVSVQPARTVIDLTPSQFSQLTFVAGSSVGDSLQIRAFDGSAWSAADNAPWAPFTVSFPVNHAPVVPAANVVAAHNQSLALTSLVSASDSDGDAITKYQLWDGNADPASGSFWEGGIIKYQARRVIEIDASRLSHFTFVAGGVSDTLQIRAFDGGVWSAPDNGAWSLFNVSVPPNHPPVVITGNVTLPRGQSVALSTLVSATDPDGDAIQTYELWDGTDNPSSGHFLLAGSPLPERTVISITASQFAMTTFQVGTSLGDNLQIRASDGAVWSAGDNAAWAPFTVVPPANHAPVVVAAPVATSHNQTIALSSLISVSDADGDTITKYQLWDGTADPSSGHFVYGGVSVLPERQVIDIFSSDISQCTFVTGTVSDTLQIRAFDGAAWSAGDNAAWSPFTVTVAANHVPAVATANKNATHGQSHALSSLITVSDSDGDSMTKYQLWDATDDPNSGHFVINGVPQAARAVIEITAAQVAQTSFVSGIVSDTLHIRAYDGAAWSAPDNGAWSPFTVTVTANHAPVVTTADRTLTHNEPQTLSSLITVNDSDGDSITNYQLWDATLGSTSGHFVINGVVQAERAVIDIAASQLAQTTFVTGDLGSGGDTLQVRAFDGFAWSAPDNGAWTPFHISVS